MFVKTQFSTLFDYHWHTNFFSLNRKLSFHRIALTITSIMIVLGACSPQSPQVRAEEIDAYLVQLARDGDFSGSVLISQEGEILLNKGYGFADIENQISNTPQTRYYIHWVTMPFTAMAVLMLQADGKLDVHNPICQYIQACPEFWDGITIHHLLTHTSGISEWIQPWGDIADMPDTSTELVARIVLEAPYFQPGERFRYSNNGYIILGHIVETVSGQPYETFIEERIFAPLGMKNTGLGENEIAVGYSVDGTQVPNPDPLYRYSASGLYSTVEDLYRFDQALYDEQLLAQEYQGLVFAGYAMTPSLDFEGAEYGYGWFIGNLLNRPVNIHGGAMTGYTAMLLRFPEERLSIIILRNQGMVIYDRLEIVLAEMIFGENQR